MENFELLETSFQHEYAIAVHKVIAVKYMLFVTGQTIRTGLQPCIQSFNLS